jgi:hypothetical protein
MESACAIRYRPLHKYLDERYANTVVLRITEIEDILGFTLPVLARLQPDWWDNRTSEQFASWDLAKRTAAPNLTAQTVTFTRSPETASLR